MALFTQALTLAASPRRTAASAADNSLASIVAESRTFPCIRECYAHAMFVRLPLDVRSEKPLDFVEAHRIGGGDATASTMPQRGESLAVSLCRIDALGE
jgi:hypothetical protein